MTQSAAQCWNLAFDVKSSSIFNIPMDTSLTHVCLSAWLFLPKGMIQFWDSYKLWLSSSFLAIWLVSTDSQLFWTVQNDSNKWLKSVLNSFFIEQLRFLPNMLSNLGSGHVYSYFFGSFDSSQIFPTLKESYVYANLNDPENI